MARTSGANARRTHFALLPGHDEADRSATAPWIVIVRSSTKKGPVQRHRANFREETMELEMLRPKRR
jgi:hypothetical protein